jgi:hypothetical protein
MIFKKQKPKRSDIYLDFTLLVQSVYGPKIGTVPSIQQRQMFAQLN